jgi:hypothetical protein
MNIHVAINTIQSKKKEELMVKMGERNIPQ